MSRMLEAALAYARRGYYVFPCMLEKNPYTSRGFKDATRDEAQIRAWWGEWPSASIGCACGATGIAVVDADSKGGANPDEVFSTLGISGGPIIRTGEAPEPNGEKRYERSLVGVRGAHAPFRGSCKTLPKTAVAGVEVRGVGSYVILPPSPHPSGVRYEGEYPPVEDLPALPDGLLETLTEGSRGARGSTNGSGAGGAPRSLTELLASPPDGVGERSNWLIAVAGALVHRHDNWEGLHDAIVDANETLRPPMERHGPGGLDATVLKSARVYWEEARADLAAGGAEKKPAVATLLVEQARLTHRFVRSEEGEVYAVPLSGPRIAVPLRGNRSFRQTLAADYFDDTGKAANSSALADALGVLEGQARREPEEAVRVRIAGDERGVTLDLGDTTGRSVIVTGAGWSVTDRSNVLFRRTALTSPFPDPQRGGSLDGMRGLLNIGDEHWSLLVGYLVAAWVPGIPHPVLWLTGEQGTGKTSALRVIGSLIDPSPALTRTPPRDVQEWVVTASGSWGLPIDNVSRVLDWFSDAMCRAATGDGLARRQLYGDNDLVVNKLRNVVMLNGIGIGQLRGDLGDRLVPIELERIPGVRRRPETELDAEWETLRPETTGALLDLLAATLAALPDIRLESLPRMADFARVLAAVDSVRGTDSLGVYLGSREAISEAVVQGDAVAVAVRLLAQSATQTAIDGARGWTGTATELLRELEGLTEREHRGKDWPINAQVLSARLTRAAPDLAGRGVQVQQGKSKKAGRKWTVRLEEEGS